MPAKGLVYSQLSFKPQVITNIWDKVALKLQFGVLPSPPQEEETCFRPRFPILPACSSNGLGKLPPDTLLSILAFYLTSTFHFSLFIWLSQASLTFLAIRAWWGCTTWKGYQGLEISTCSEREHLCSLSVRTFKLVSSRGAEPKDTFREGSDCQPLTGSVFWLVILPHLGLTEDCGWQEQWCCGRSQDRQPAVRCREELRQDRRRPATKTLPRTEASAAFPCCQWVPCSRRCLLLPAQPNISFAHRATEIRLFKLWHKGLYSQRPYGNTTAGYFTRPPQVPPFHCFLRDEERSEEKGTADTSDPRSITTRARTHSELFHLPSETLLVSFKANVVLCVVLKHKFCSNTAGEHMKSSGEPLATSQSWGPSRMGESTQSCSPAGRKGKWERKVWVWGFCCFHFYINSTCWTRYVPSISKLRRREGPLRNSRSGAKADRTWLSKDWKQICIMSPLSSWILKHSEWKLGTAVPPSPA